VSTAGSGAFTGDTFDLSGLETVDGVNGVAPADYDLLVTQTFEVENAAGTQIGTFGADVANSSDVLGNSTQDILVTSSSGDAPTVGSVIDYAFLSDSGSSTYSVYSDIPSTTGSDTITDSIVSPYGSFNVPTTFDAAAGLADSLNGTSPLGTAIDLPDSYDITPDSTSPETTTIDGIDGIQPGYSEVQGTQLFAYDPATGPVGTFDADVAQSAVSFGNSTQEQLVVTSDVSGSAPAVGSVFEVYNYGDGYETIYSDVPSATGSDTITDTFVTPFGDFNMPDSYDAAAALGGTSIDSGASTAAVTDVLGSLDTGALADLFPNIDAALNALSSLF
jgi:hypothetical protein